MSFSYLASFDFCDRRNDFGSVTFTKTGGGTFSLNLLTDVANGLNSFGEAIRVSNHYPNGLTNAVGEDAEANTGLQKTAATQSWGALFQQRMRQAAAGAGWASSSSLTCAYNADTFRYTFTYASTLTAITFSNLKTAWLFGFASSWTGSATSVSGSLTPTFVIVPVLSAVTMENADGFNYEPAGISRQCVSEYGSVFGRTRACAPLFRDWTQQSETRLKAIRATSGSVYFSHEDLFKNCRSVLPFVVIDGFGDGRDYVFRLRPDSCMWSTNVIKRAGGDMDDTLFDVVYGAQVLGAFS